MRSFRAAVCGLVRNDRSHFAAGPFQSVKKVQLAGIKVSLYEGANGGFGCLQGFPNCQKATALAAATFRESTPWDMGIFTV